jgi:hypothetical protein
MHGSTMVFPGLAASLAVIGAGENPEPDWRRARFRARTRPRTVDA